MTMTLNECIDYVKANPQGFLATIEGDQPHVRPMTVWLADRTGFYFYTSRVKPLFSQIQAHPQVEIALQASGKPPDIGTILRIAGRMEMVEDLEIRRRLYKTMPWLEKIGTGKPDSPTIVVFKIGSGRFNFWTWENNVNPGPWVPFP